MGFPAPQHGALREQRPATGIGRHDRRRDARGTAARDNRSVAVPLTQSARVADDERHAGSERLISRALHGLFAVGERQDDVGTAQQRPVRRVVEIAGQRDVGRQVVDRPVGATGENKLDVRQQVRSRNDVVYGLVVVPAAREDRAHRKPDATSVVRRSVGHNGRRVVEHEHTQTAEPAGELGPGHEHQFGVAGNDCESAARLARPRADDGG